MALTLNGSTGIVVADGATIGSTSDTDAITVPANGRITFNQAILAQAGVQPNANSYTAAEVLDDYEEGTWTPALAGVSTAGSYSTSSASGTYTKIGRFVTAFFSIQAGTLSGHSGNIQLTGFPFTATNGGGGYFTYVEGQSFSFTSSTTNTTVFLNSSSANSNYLPRPQNQSVTYDKFVTGLTDGSIDGYLYGQIHMMTA